MKRNFKIVPLCMLLLFLTACGNPKLKNGKEVVVKVKGYNVTADDLYKELKTNYGYNYAITMINKYIAKKEIKDSKELDEKTEEALEYYKNYAKSSGLDLSSFIQYYLGIPDVKTEKELKSYLKEQYRLKMAIDNQIANGITDEEAKEYYDTNYSETLTVKHILIKPENEDDEESAKEIAASIISKLDETDKDDLDEKFNELAREYSADSTYDNGGLIENFVAGDVVREFYDASTALEDGEYTKEPVKSPYGYHVILKVSETEKKSFKKAKKEIKEKLAEQKSANDQNAQATALKELHKKYNIKIYDTDIKNAYENE